MELENAIDMRAITELRANVGDDDEFLAELIDEFLADAPLQLESLREGLGTGDAERARRAAHTLKGTSRTFGAGALGLLCEEVEAQLAAGDLDAGLARLDAMDVEWFRVRGELAPLRTGSV